MLGLKDGRLRCSGGSAPGSAGLLGLRSQCDKRQCIGMKGYIQLKMEVHSLV